MIIKRFARNFGLVVTMFISFTIFAAISDTPEFSPPSAVEDACALELENMPRYVVPAPGAFRYVGAGAYSHGPMGSGDRSVHVALADREINVDAVTGNCSTPQPPGPTAHQLIFGQLETAVMTYKLRVKLAKDSKNDEALSGTQNFKNWLSDTLNKCSGFSNPRGIAPGWLKPKLDDLRRQLMQISTAPPTNPATGPEVPANQ